MRRSSKIAYICWEIQQRGNLYSKRRAYTLGLSSCTGSVPIGRLQSNQSPDILEGNILFWILKAKTKGDYRAGSLNCEKYAILSRIMPTKIH